MPSLRRAARRASAIVVATTALLAIGALPAEARMCWIGAGPPEGIWYPCPGPQDQPVPAPVWVTTNSGPGWKLEEWNFIKVSQGSRVFLTVTLFADPVRLHGAGFDSGIVNGGSTAEVVGVPSLPLGEYPIYDIDGWQRGLLIIEKSAVCVECVT